MVLNGIPISDDQCIGDSLQYINSAFQTLSTNVLTLSGSTKALSVVDSPTIDLSYNSTTGTLSASVSSIDSFFTGTNRSLVTPSGFQKLPGGLIINWGRANIAGEGTVVLNYAQSFTGEVLGVSVAALGTAGDNWAIIGAFPTSLTQINLGRNWSGAGTNETNWCFYIAIGY